MDRIKNNSKTAANLPPSSTRVQKGPYTIDMHPKKTRELVAAGNLFARWRTNPVRISALFAMIPSNFPGIIDIEADEIRRQSERSGGHPGAHFRKE